MEHTLWSHLPLLVRSNSKESVEYILQALWRTRKTGLDPADRDIIRDMLQLQNESDIDPVHYSHSFCFQFRIFMNFVLFIGNLLLNFIWGNLWNIVLYFVGQLLVCLRMLIRRCVYDNVKREEIQKLFPSEVLPELQRLLTLLLQKFQGEWRRDALKDQVRDSRCSTFVCKHIDLPGRRTLG